jgi:hypothetical protein
VRALTALVIAIVVGAIWKPSAFSSTLGEDKEQFRAPTYMTDQGGGERIAVLNITPCNDLGSSRKNALDITSINKFAGLLISVRGYCRERFKWCIFTSEVERERDSDPMRCPEIPKRVNGVPMATGWLILFGSYGDGSPAELMSVNLSCYPACASTPYRSHRWAVWYSAVGRLVSLNVL